MFCLKKQNSPRKGNLKTLITRKYNVHLNEFHVDINLVGATYWQLYEYIINPWNVIEIK